MKNLKIYIIVGIILLSLSTGIYAIKEREMNALKLHIDSVVLDSHNDTMMKVIDEETWLPVVDIRNNTPFHVDIPKMRAGNLRGAFFAAYTSDFYGNPERALSRTLALVNALYWTEKNNSDIFNITSTYEEIQSSIKEWKIAAIPSIEGGYSITEENYLQLIKQYHDLGVKAIAFNWNFSNALGEGANEVYADESKTKSSGGLTNLGKKAIKEMNELGIIVDVSHMNEETFWGVIKASKAPIMASHSGAYTIRPHRRNLKDDQLKAIKDSNGVAAMVMYRDFVKSLDDAYIKDYVDHIDYVVNLIGIDHVAIGSDFDGAELPLDMKDSSELYKITEELVKRGYKEGDIKKLLGLNTLRVIKDVEAFSKKTTKADNISIKPSLKMGDEVDNPPLLIGEITGRDIDVETIKVIVDGLEYNPNFNNETSTISLQLGRPLTEKFHVVTFEVANNDGEIVRATKIFYVE